MIELLIIWLVTIVISYGLKFVNEIRLFKLAADFGYKIDMKKLFRLSTKISKESIITNLSMLMPVYNMFTTLEKTIQCNNAKYKALEQSGLIDALHRMTDEEKEQYLEKPTGFNAAHIALEDEIKVSHYKTEKDDNTIKSKNHNLIDRIIHQKGELQKLKQELLDSSLEQNEMKPKKLRLTKWQKMLDKSKIR